MTVQPVERRVGFKSLGLRAWSFSNGKSSEFRSWGLGLLSEPYVFRVR